MSYSPPNDIQNVWVHEAWRRFGYGLGSILAGVVVFLTTKKDFQIRKSRIVTVLVSLIVLLILFPYARREIIVNSCLDSGGSWDQQHDECNNEAGG
jgi:hypothetical protein